MFEVIIYASENGKSSVKDFFDSLHADKSKNARINLKKVLLYLKMLSENGLQLRPPIIKKIEGEIWELRPLDNRILFFAWNGNAFVLLHHFVKKTQKTPKNEIEQAQQNMLNFKKQNQKKGL